MARDENETSPGRVFSLLEANQLIPQLQLHLSAVREGKTVLMRTREEANKASANACFGGGTPVGVSYVKSLQDISANLHAIHELGVVVKDIDLSRACRLTTSYCSDCMSASVARSICCSRSSMRRLR
jgi:hypothetical protein